MREGRPFWILRPMMLAITMVCLALVGLLILTLVLSGDIAASVAAEVGLGDEVLRFWEIAKWPLVGLIAVLIVAVLYYATPNVKKAKFRFLSGGAVVAIVLWVIVSWGCAYYLNEIANFSKTYGSLAGVIGGLLSLWLANMALLIGAEIDAELTRARQLQRGLPAEDEVQLPPRSDRGLKKLQRKQEEFRAEGRADPPARRGGSRTRPHVSQGDRRLLVVAVHHVRQRFPPSEAGQLLADQPIGTRLHRAAVSPDVG